MISLCLLLSYGEILLPILLFGICETKTNLKFPHFSLNPSLIDNVSGSQDTYNETNKQTKREKQYLSIPKFSFTYSVWIV